MKKSIAGAGRGQRQSSVKTLLCWIRAGELHGRGGAGRAEVQIMMLMMSPLPLGIT